MADAATKAANAARIAEKAKAAAQHIASLPAEHRDFAEAYWEWVLNGQRGQQPVAPDAVKGHSAIQHAINQIHAS